jgi:hypothetical protein
VPLCLATQDDAVPLRAGPVFAGFSDLPTDIGRTDNRVWATPFPAKFVSASLPMKPMNITITAIAETIAAVLDPERTSF